MSPVSGRVLRKAYWIPAKMELWMEPGGEVVAEAAAMSGAARILVVDDEPEALLLASYVLEQEGFEILKARTGGACLEAVRAHHPDLVLLDRMLPDMDGLEACRQIKDDPGLSDIFVLLYSALKTTSDHQASGLESGADGYLVRPIGNRELVARVKAILRVKRARDASRRSEGRFRSLFENALVGIYRMMPDGGMLLANPALLHMLGYASFEELAQRTKGQDGHGPGASRTAFTEAIERDGTVSGWESTWIRRDGSIVHVRESARAVRDSSGGTLYYEGIVEDVTERKEASERIRASEQKFRDVFDSAGDAILIHDLSGHLLEANRMACERLGYSREQLLRMSVSDIDAPPYVAQFAQRIRLLSERGQAVFESAHVAHDGTVIPIELNKRMIEYEGQQAVLSIARDISERVRAEGELRLSARRLEGLRAIDQAILDGHPPEQVAQAALQRVQNMVPCAGAWVVVFGPNGQGSRVLAAQFERPDGTLATAFRALEQQSRLAEPAHGQGQTRAGPGPESSPAPTIAAMRAAGVRTYATVPIKAQERTVGQLVLVADVARRFTPEEIEIAKELAAEVAVAVRQADLRAALAAERASLVENVETRTAELRIANAELARAARLKDEFLAAMSHELRTPLNAILGLSESLLEGVYGSPNEKQARSLRSIAESGHHLLDLINDILDVAKIEADKLGLDLGIVSIPLICESSMGLIKQAAKGKRIKTSLALSSSATEIEADGRRLKQILVNLLSNAVKFTPEGGEIGLRVQDDPAHDMTHFSVWDTGIGIAAEDIARLFRPFVQVDSSLSRRYQGTGLGLALVDRLTKMHGGRVSVKSKVGSGSCFTVSLPRRTGETAQAQPEEPGDVDVRVAAVPEFSHCLVLLAEDDETNISVMRDYLEAKGCRVLVARDGLEALARVRQRRPDLILMDIQMPNMDGLEATRRLRADAHTADIPVIALTALAMAGDRERCLEAGADAYLSKPVRLHELADMVETYSSRN
ncbi:MAG: response regulator [Anaerolineae bacterium]